MASHQRARDEWEMAKLHNAQTRCNGLLPLWGAQISENAFTTALARYSPIDLRTAGLYALSLNISTAGTTATSPKLAVCVRPHIAKAFTTSSCFSWGLLKRRASQRTAAAVDVFRTRCSHRIYCRPRSSYWTRMRHKFYRCDKQQIYILFFLHITDTEHNRIGLLRIMQESCNATRGENLSGLPGEAVTHRTHSTRVRRGRSFLLFHVRTSPLLARTMACLSHATTAAPASCCAPALAL